MQPNVLSWEESKMLTEDVIIIEKPDEYLMEYGNDSFRNLDKVDSTTEVFTRGTGRPRKAKLAENVISANESPGDMKKIDHTDNEPAEQSIILKKAEPQTRVRPVVSKNVSKSQKATNIQSYSGSSIGMKNIKTLEKGFKSKQGIQNPSTSKITVTARRSTQMTNNTAQNVPSSDTLTRNESTNKSSTIE